MDHREWKKHDHPPCRHEIVMTLGAFAQSTDADTLEKRIGEFAAIMPVMVSQEVVPLPEALGRFLAHAVIAPISVPISDLATGEGYAVSTADLDAYNETRLPLSANIPPGMHFFLPKHFQGSAAYVFDGSPIPQGANTVFLQEHVKRAGDFITVPYGQEAGRNIRRAGGDFSLGEPVLPAGTKLSPQHLATCAAFGLSHLHVFSPLRVAVFSIGQNLLDTRYYKGSPLVGARFDANRVMLVSLLNARGITALDLGILPHDWERIFPALELAATGCDVILCSSDLSIHKEDRAGFEVMAQSNIHFYDIAIKPGSHLAVGLIGACPFFGIPDTAFAGFVAFTRFVAPLLDKLGGGLMRISFGFPVTAAFSYAKARGRRDYLPVTIHLRRDGRRELRLSPKTGEELLSPLATSHGLAEIPEQVSQVLAGDHVHFLPISMLFNGED